MAENELSGPLAFVRAVCFTTGMSKNTNRCEGCGAYLAVYKDHINGGHKCVRCDHEAPTPKKS